MKVLTAAYYEFIKNLRDVKMLAILVVFPVLTIFILGNAIKGYFSTDSDRTFSVAYVNQDTGAVGSEFDKFLDNNDIKEKLEVTRYGSKAQGQQAVEDGKANALIYLPADLSENIYKGNKQAIQVYGKKGAEFVESLVNGFISSFNAVNAVVEAGGKPVELDTGSSLKRISYTKNAVLPSAIDYYSILTLLQVLVMGAILGVFITTKTSGSDIHIRIHSLPFSQWKLLLGRTIGSVAYLFLTAIITLMFTKIVYHANWNGNPLIIAATLLAFSIIAVGIGLALGLTVQSFSTSLMIMLLLMMFFSIVSGAISPATVFDPLGLLSPNYHAKVILFGTIYGYSKQVMLEAALWLAGYTAAIYGIVAVFLRRVKYDNV